MTTKERVIEFKAIIESGAIECGLNLTVYDGKIAFVDQKAKKIVALWTPEYKLSDTEDKKCKRD